MPSLEGPHWTVVNATNGDVITKIEPNSGAHNTIYAPDGSRVYLAGLKSNLLTIADPKTHTIVGHGRAVRGADPAVHGERAATRWCS